ncbi:hypothetical protein ACS0PU_004834 [Formica fusca]
MDNEKLIELVRQHVELYDLSHSKYLDGNHKEKIWKSISQELDQPVNICKTRWNNIRDNYRKSLKKRVTTRGQSAIKINKYKYEDQLSFLSSFLKERDTVSNVTSGHVETQEISLDNNADDNNGTMVETFSNEDNEITQETSDCTKHKFMSSIRQQSRQEKSKAPESASSIVMKYTVEKNEKKGILQTVHPVDAFLNGLAPTLKNLSPYSLNIAKSKIFSIVQEIDLYEIREQQTQVQANNNYPSTSDYYPATPSLIDTTLPLPSSSSIHTLLYVPEIELDEIMEQQTQLQANNKHYSSTSDYYSATPSPIDTTLPSPSSSSMHTPLYSPISTLSSTSSEHFIFPAPTPTLLQQSQPNIQYNSSEASK